MRKLGLTANFSENFADVSSDMYYYQDIGIAKALGIATGVGANQFSPHANISRQDMFALIYSKYIQGNEGYIHPKENETRAECLWQNKNA